MDGQAKRWLINKNSEVLGPMSLEEVVRGVKEGQFHLKLEAKPPGGGWRLITQQSEIVEALRLEGVDLPSDQSTSSTLQFTQSTTVQNGTTTGPTDAFFEEDYPEVTVVQGASLPKSNPPQPPPKVYEWSGAPASAPARFGGLVIWISVIVLALAGGWGLIRYKQTGTSPLAGAEELQQLILRADDLRDLGRYQEALWHYRKAFEMNPHGAEVQFKMIPVILYEEHQSVFVDRLISDLRLSLTRPEDLKVLFNLKGLSDLYAGRWVEARSALDESLALDSIYGPALWNRAMTYFMEGDFTSAITDFGNLKAAFPEMADLFQQWSYFGGGFADRVDFDKLMQPRFSFQQESFLLGLWISVKTGDRLKAQRFAEKLLTTDVHLSELHAREPILFLQPAQWTNMLPLCQEIEGGLEAKWQEEAVLGLCHLKAQNGSTALRYFEKSFSRHQSSQIQTLLAYLYFGQGEMDRARLLMSETNSSEDLKSLLLLRLKVVENDTRQMEPLIESLTDTRFALHKEYFYSWLALQKGALDKAKFHWRKAQTLSPGFFPLRELKGEIYRE